MPQGSDVLFRTDGVYSGKRKCGEGCATEVYLDLVLILNFTVDFLLLLGTNRLSGHPPGVKRACLASAAGAGYAAACFLPGFGFLASPLWRLVSLALMGSIAFGLNGSAVRRSGVFLLLSMALGGFASGMNRSSFSALVVSAGLLWGLCRLSFSGRIGGSTYVPVEVITEGRKVTMTALRDTGNTLRDPLTGEQVLVVDSRMAEKLTGLTVQQLRSPMETMLQNAGGGYRLIPYRAVGQPGSMLLGKRFSNVMIGSVQQSAVIAFAPDPLDRTNTYQALTGGVV